jgi:hypothetical protein
MKFKQLIANIQTLAENSGEHSEGGGGLYAGQPNPGPSALTDKGTFNLALPRSIDAINALLYSFSNRDYIDPDGVMAVVKQKLNHFGLDFACKGGVQDGENSYELVQYGSTQLGVYGQNPYDDVNIKGFSQGDGIKEKLGHSLSLIVNVEKMPSSLRKVSMMIVPTPTSSYNTGDMVGTDCGCEH